MLRLRKSTNSDASLFTGLLSKIASSPNFLFICITLLAISGGQKANADTSDVRGIWYESAGIDQHIIKQQIETFKKLGVQRVHLVVTHRFDEVGRYCDCAREVYGADVALGICANPKKKSLVPANDQGKNSQVNVCAARKHFFAFDRWPKRSLLGRFVDNLGRAGIQTVLTIWPEPTQNYIDIKPCDGQHRSSLGCLIQFVKAHHKYIYAIELEDEDNWSERYLRDFEGGASDFINLTQAANYLIPTIKNALTKRKNLDSDVDASDVRVGVTTDPKHFDKANFSSDMLLLRSDFISFQSYQPVCPRNRRTGKVQCDERNLLSGEFAPGIMQERAIELVRALGTHSLLLGLPAYDQGPDTAGDVNDEKGVENMYIAAKKAICAAKEAAASGSTSPRFIGDSYWSYLNVKRQRVNHHAYAERFLTSCKVSNIEQHCYDSGADVSREVGEVCGITWPTRRNE
jgi:hypothetical protein